MGFSEQEALAVTKNTDRPVTSHPSASWPKGQLVKFPGIARPSAAVSKFPPMYFLDSRLFRQSQVALPTAELPIPSSVSALIGDLAARRAVATEYFNTIHIWFPFISKKRFLLSLVNQFAEPRADVALLILCMKLITWSPSEHGVLEETETPSYLTAKRFFLELQAAGILTLQLAQACILLTVYEMGHAIFPAAYISVGTSFRYVMALGLNGKITPHTTDPTVWMMQEEKRRVWWTTIILDRCKPISHSAFHAKLTDINI
jgi:hypothetical protein